MGRPLLKLRKADLYAHGDDSRLAVEFPDTYLHRAMAKYPLLEMMNRLKISIVDFWAFILLDLVSENRLWNEKSGFHLVIGHSWDISIAWRQIRES